ncbi:MAG TPA: hypothetical protein VMN56_01330 [Casimicrobiaceae bacterium]|nr:hypothetical protein [Casimicrobiaceae bacterium]
MSKSKDTRREVRARIKRAIDQLDILLDRRNPPTREELIKFRASLVGSLLEDVDALLTPKRREAHSGGATWCRLSSVSGIAWYSPLGIEPRRPYTGKLTNDVFPSPTFVIMQAFKTSTADAGVLPSRACWELHIVRAQPDGGPTWPYAKTAVGLVLNGIRLGDYDTVAGAQSAAARFVRDERAAALRAALKETPNEGETDHG